MFQIRLTHNAHTNIRFQRLLCITNTCAQLRAADSDEKMASKHLKTKTWSQVIATLVAEIGHNSNHRTHKHITLSLGQIHRKL